MAVLKIFNDEKDRQLTAFYNSEGTCTIVAGKDILNDNQGYFYGLCNLDSNDITELIAELKFIKKQIDG